MAKENTTERPQLQLPPTKLDGSVTVERALAERRSRRSYSRRPLTLDEVSQLLWAAQGITHSVGYRTAPSAGALFPLEVLLVAGEVTDLTAGIYRYAPDGHRLRAVIAGDRRHELALVAATQTWLRRAPAILVLTGVVGRLAARYGSRAERYVLMEVGAAAENIYLQATAMDLATVLLAAFQDDAVAKITRLEAEERPYALLPVGAR